MQFDYVIVGGGSAGAVLANRLSARPGNRVALFEAGPDTPPDAVPDIIADSYPGLSYFDPRYHWTDLRVYNRSPRLNDGSARLAKLEQAKVMGGGSSINGQFAVRGLPVDYDGWEAMGLPGWGWSGMLPISAKLERDLDFDGELHGKDGRIPIRRVFPEQWAGFTRDVLQAVEEEGPTYRPDYNATTEDGCFPLPLSNENERRVSTAIGYLDAETRKRPNLAIFPLTFVERIVFEGNRVKGLDIVRGGQRQRVEAGEVIVSSGALHSPAVLMRSGVGPAGHLRHHGIEVVADVPGVGENLTEHPHLAVGAHLKPPARLPRAMRRHIFLGVRYSSGVEGCDPGDMLIMPVNRAGWHPLGRSLGALNVCVNKSYSTGTVRLNSADPAVEPEVDLNLASDGRDLVRLVDGFKRLYRIMESPAVQAGINTWFLAGYTDAVRALSVRKPIQLAEDRRRRRAVRLCAVRPRHADKAPLRHHRADPRHGPRRRGDRRVGQVHGLAGLARLGNLPARRRRRSHGRARRQMPGARGPGAARGGCLHHALDLQRQHQHHHHRHRREGRGPDPERLNSKEPER